MKEVFVQFPTLEVVQVLDEELSEELGREFLAYEEQERIVAILLALRDLELISYRDRGRETWFFFDPKENYADDVLQITLKKSKMLRSIVLSKHIQPALRETWQRASGIDDEAEKAIECPIGSQNDELELDPFVSQLALWIDKEVAAERSEFKALEIGARIARICLELQKERVAVRTGTDVNSMWTTAVTINLRIGGAKVSDNVRFRLSDGANVALLDQFQEAVGKHAQMRLASMLEIEEEFFQLYNLGKLKIATIDPEGHYRWAAIGAVEDDDPSKG